jgi:hypothetical protein
MKSNRGSFVGRRGDPFRMTALWRWRGVMQRATFKGESSAHRKATISTVPTRRSILTPTVSP